MIGLAPRSSLFAPAGSRYAPHLRRSASTHSETLCRPQRFSRGGMHHLPIPSLATLGGSSLRYSVAGDMRVVDQVLLQRAPARKKTCHSLGSSNALCLHITPPPSLHRRSCKSQLRPPLPAAVGLIPSPLPSKSFGEIPADHLDHAIYPSPSFSHHPACSEPICPVVSRRHLPSGSICMLKEG
ncbi:hypothetical protein CALCODRAFT_51366 [Calocera cornea HHB12733]|uniref:Uncharacterized protein n=1 Tax=Calocera cornea HHB12733 TaxID=1353952 RepID=A0A165DSB4_9BASI|nr:hypothetical protein CALCODRAFT_51366 [Calocera cornea HHB12733]